MARTDELFTRLRDGEARQAEVVTRILRPDGTMVWVNVSASVADDPEGRPAYLVLHLQDITARETAEARLIEQAERDALTGLSNRTVLAQRAGAALAQGEAALLFVDLDRFKLVNDSLGHATGDELLVAVGRRLAGIGPSPTVSSPASAATNSSCWCRVRPRPRPMPTASRRCWPSRSGWAGGCCG